MEPYYEDMRILFTTFLILLITSSGYAQTFTVERDVNEKKDFYKSLAEELEDKIESSVLKGDKQQAENLIEEFHTINPSLGSVIVFKRAGSKYHEHFLSKYFLEDNYPLVKIHYVDNSVMHINFYDKYVLIDTPRNENIYYRLSFSIPSNNQTFTVERVIDGDTLKLTNGEELQLIGI